MAGCTSSLANMTDQSAHSVISFLSDFGLDDEFVGVVHGVIATIAPGCRVIDIHHAVPAGDIQAGGLALMRAIQYLPPGVVLAVVDPGVGTGRKAIAAETSWGYFVGPDNGLLSPAVALMGGVTRAVSIENPDVMLPGLGATFEGRDRFAPAAAVLASGEARLEDLGPTVEPDSLVPLLLPLSEIADARVTGQAWWVDTFGNVQTNIAPEDMAGAGMEPGQTITVRVGLVEYAVPWVLSYADVDEGRALLHVDSSGLLALAVRRGRATDHFTLPTGTAVVFSKSE